MKISNKFLLPGLLALISASGCVSINQYFQNRVSDFADIFTAKVGYGYGVHAGFSAGMICASVGGGEFTRWGFEGGKMTKEKHFVYGVPVYQIFFYLHSLRDRPDICLDTPNTVYYGGATVCNMMLFPLMIGTEYIEKLQNTEESAREYSKDAFIFHGRRIYLGLGINIAPIVGDNFGERDVTTSQKMSYYDIRVHASCFGCFEFGINPAQFLDFILGWTTLDIAGDDSK